MKMKENIKKIFPFVERAHEAKQLAIVIVTYLIIALVAGLLIGLLATIPVVGIIMGIVGALLEIWVIAAIVLAVLVYCKILEL